MKKIKRKISLILMLCLVCGIFSSCAPKPEEVFKTQADTWLTAYSDYQGAMSGQTSYEYAKTGSVAENLPKSNIAAVQSAINSYCDVLKQEFRSVGASDKDELLISYKAYAASADITGVEIISRQIIDGTQTDKTKLFTFDSSGVFNAEKTLLNSVKINARDMVAKSAGATVDKDKLKSYTDFEMLFTESGIDVMYPGGSICDAQSGDIRVTVPYSAVRYALPESIKQNVPEQERVVDITKKLVALTFDDGPHDVYTNEILDTLEKNGAVATFFDVGNRMELGAKVMKRAKALGCELGTHSYSHANMGKASADKIRDEITKSNAVYKSILGEDPVLMRPPYGSVGQTLRDTATQYLIGWSVDTLDWKSRDAQKILKVVKGKASLDGDVILMHAIYKSSAEAVEQLVPWLEDNGYQLVTVSELMKYKYNDEFKTGTYYTGSYFKGTK